MNSLRGDTEGARSAMSQRKPAPGPTDRLRAELTFNAARADHEPVTDSSLTYGDLRAFGAMFAVSNHTLADMLRDREPIRQPDDGDTEMEITVEDARRIAWALMGSSAQRDDLLNRIRSALSLTTEG